MLTNATMSVPVLCLCSACSSAFAVLCKRDKRLATVTQHKNHFADKKFDIKINPSREPNTETERQREDSISYALLCSPLLLYSLIVYINASISL